jgi:hypothetical protein
MNAVTDQTALLQCFRELDRADVDHEGVAFPIAVDQVTTWANGPRAYLLFRDRPGGPPKGIVFHRNNSAAPTVATMCQWCHRVRGHGGVKLLSVRSSERQWVGQYLCSDLDCLMQEVPGVDDLRESLDEEARNARTIERIRSFAARRLF